jgi:putative phage-type endonuclease
MKNYTISGTEIGSILGLNPYQSPMDLYMRKLGLIDPPVENEAMKWGSAAEHVVARRYAKETGAELYPSIDKGYDYKDPCQHPHPDNYWWIGTPDRFIKSGPGLLEIKIVGERMAHQWGDAPDGDVPEQYLTQVAWYMPLLGVEWADLAVQIGNRDYRVYRINRDREFEDQLRDAALAFINDHLIPEIPPAIDGSESSKRYLNYKYPQEQGPVLEPTDEDILGMVSGLRLAKENVKLWETKASLMENTIKGIIGDAAGMRGDWGKITWTKNRDSIKIDYGAIVDDVCAYIPADVYDDSLKKHTTIKPGARVFRPYFAKED